MSDERTITLNVNVLNDVGDVVFNSKGDVVTTPVTININTIKDILDHARQVVVCYFYNVADWRTAHSRIR